MENLGVENIEVVYPEFNDHPNFINFYRIE
jgi:hypothetical protein